MDKRVPLKIRFLVLLARRLHEYGASAYRLEGAVSEASEALGLECDLFSGPTSCLISFLDDSEAEEYHIRTKVIRLEPGQVDLGRLAWTDEIANLVMSGDIDLEEGYRRLQKVATFEHMPLTREVLATVTASGGVAVLLGANLLDLGAALVAGLLMGLLAIGPEAIRKKGAYEAVSALLTTLLVYALAHFLPGLSRELVIMAGLIVLMPGLTLTTAMAELATNHLVSGGARLAGAGVTLLKLTFGVVLGTRLAEVFALTPLAGTQAALPNWAEWAALLLTAWAFTALFHTRLRDMPAALTAALTGYAASKLVAHFFDPDFALFAAGLVVAALGNLYARVLHRPASIFRLPGIILLVPGSLSYRSTTLVFAKDALTGLDMGMAVLVLLSSLVAGQLFGNMLVAPRRSL